MARPKIGNKVLKDRAGGEHAVPAIGKAPAKILDIPLASIEPDVFHVLLDHRCISVPFPFYQVTIPSVNTF